LLPPALPDGLPPLPPPDALPPFPDAPPDCEFVRAEPLLPESEPAAPPD
jgi:hypothetical protein